MGRDSFIVYRSFYGLIKLLPTKERVKIYEAIFEFGFDEIMPKFEDERLKAIWGTILPQLKANNRKYQDGLKGKDYGTLGGAPKGNTNAKKQPLDTIENNTSGVELSTENSYEKQPLNSKNNNPIGVKNEGNKNNPKTTPNENVNVNVNVNENVNVNKESTLASTKEKSDGVASRPRFNKPSFDAVIHFFKNINAVEESEKFYNYYESNGWMVGRNPMRDWEAAARGWKAHGETFGGTKKEFASNQNQPKQDVMSSNLRDNLKDLNNGDIV